MIVSGLPRGGAQGDCAAARPRGLPLLATHRKWLMRRMICLGMVWLLLLGGVGCDSKKDKDKDSGEGTGPKRIGARRRGKDKNTKIQSTKNEKATAKPKGCPRSSFPPRCGPTMAGGKVLPAPAVPWESTSRHPLWCPSAYSVATPSLQAAVTHTRAAGRENADRTASARWAARSSSPIPPNTAGPQELCPAPRTPCPRRNATRAATSGPA